MTKRKILEALTKIESNGAGFWRRGKDNVINIFVRGEHGNDPNQWINARSIENYFGCRVIEGAKPDWLSGTITMSIEGFYKRKRKAPKA